MISDPVVKALEAELQLVITLDFIMDLLSYGEEVKVLKPNNLADEIRNAHKNAVDRYE